MGVWQSFRRGDSARTNRIGAHSTARSIARRGRPRQADAASRRSLEALEGRLLLTSGPQLISIIPNDGSLLSPNETVHTAPTQLTFRFLLGAGETLDPATLGGIQLVRSGGDAVFGNANDASITPGYVGIDPAQPNQVVMRFSSPLPDDLYRIRLDGSDAKALKDQGTPPLPFNGGVDETQDFRLQLGPQVLSVVPQPVTRDPSGALQVQSNEIDVYFDKPLATLPGQPTHLDPRQFQLIATQNTADTGDDVSYNPQTATYDPLNNEARLTFSSDIGSLPGASTGAFRLRVGNNDAAVPPPAGAAP
ncbi:MAG TPA: hypothetical protein VGN42_05420, partial [Pirellulales bacterium]|nr:hypothetical protein [Pirellulales bacterium]